MTDKPRRQSALRVADTGAVVAHRAGGQAARLQNLQCRNSCLILAAPGIIEHAQNRADGRRVSRRTDAAVRATDSNAASVTR